MANPKSIISSIEGVIGSTLLAAVDTVNNVAQAADTWKRTVTKDMSLLDPTTNVFFETLALTATIGTVNNASTTMRLYGVIGRNNDAAPRHVRFSNVSTVLGDLGYPALEIGCMTLATRSAANSPAYGFLSYPGGLDVALQGALVSAATKTLNAIATTTPSGTVAATDVNAWFLYSA